MWDAIFVGLDPSHDLTTSLGLNHIPQVLYTPSFLTTVDIRVDRYAHPQQSKVLKHSVYK